MMENNFHILRSNPKLNIQNDFIFVDVESNINKSQKNIQILTFKLGCAIFWNKDSDKKYKKTYYNISEFWNDVEYFIFKSTYKKKKRKEVILFAHNVEFDFRQLNGYRELFKRGWDLISHYIKQSVFIFIFKKENYILHIWSTTNYVHRPLEKIGESLNLPKLKINFEKDSIEYLEKYCMRDTEIIYQFIKQLVNWLEINGLSKLKATAGSLSLNIFRHKFYKPQYKNNCSSKNIYIHDWRKTIKLERKSYKGGITDCFQLGYKKEVYKLDINSMYSKSMRDYSFPYRLLNWNHEGNNNQKQLFGIYNRCKYKPNYGIIAKVIINIPEKYAYIINNFGLGKSSFAYGENIEITLCSPELEFIEKYGKIKKIKQIAIYATKRIFRKFVKYFYRLRMYYKSINNKILVEFCKLILNTLYGKWGQKRTITKFLTEDDKEINQYSELIKLMIQRRKEILNITDKDLINNIIYLGTIMNICELYLINTKLYIIKQTQENSEDSFVAISSFITSYSRMLLVKYILQVKRKNLYYTDTDSLFVNKEGYNNLQNFNSISKTKLGKLKIEEIGSCEVYAPKFYDFNDKRKVKGINQKGAIILSENKNRVIYQIEQWQKAKTALKENHYEQQFIISTKKEAKKLYDKGKINNNIITPYSISEIQFIINSN